MSIYFHVERCYNYLVHLGVSTSNTKFCLDTFNKENGATRKMAHVGTIVLELLLGTEAGSS
jgi:hypothetical protein